MAVSKYAVTSVYRFIYAYYLDVDAHTEYIYNNKCIQCASSTSRQLCVCVCVATRPRYIRFEEGDGDEINTQQHDNALGLIPNFLEISSAVTSNARGLCCWLYLCVRCDKRFP